MFSELVRQTLRARRRAIAFGVDQALLRFADRAFDKALFHRQKAVGEWRKYHYSSAKREVCTALSCYLEVFKPLHFANRSLNELLTKKHRKQSKKP